MSGSQRGIMQELTIEKYHVIYQGSREKQPLIEALSLSKFVDIVLRWDNYRDYLLRTHHMSLGCVYDYDRHPFEDNYDLKYNSGFGRKASEDIVISIRFYSTIGDDYDYVAMASSSTINPYIEGGATRPVETRFKASGVFLKRKEGDAEIWFQHEVKRIQRILDDLDAATASLSNWANSDVNMKVFCSTIGCQANKSPAIIPPSQLLTYSNAGLSLDNLKERLKCKFCGARCGNIKPA